MKAGEMDRYQLHRISGAVRIPGELTTIIRFVYVRFSASMCSYRLCSVIVLCPIA